MIPGIELHTIANMPPVTLGLLIMPMLMRRGGGGQSAGLMAALALVLPFLAQLWVARLAAEQMGVVIAGMAVVAHVHVQEFDCRSAVNGKAG